MRASVALPSARDAAETATAWLAHIAAFAERRRWWIVGLCVLGQWLFVGHEALSSIPHNGWIYEHGDDGTWYWTSAWTLTSLHVPLTQVGPGWPYVIAPLAALFGPDMANGLPGVIALNVVVLGPAAVVGMYLLAERIAGRLFGVWAAVLWTVLPALALGLYHARERATVVRFFLPTATGLNALADYPSTVCAIYGAYLLLRAFDTNAHRDALLCGLVLGFLVLLKPANGPLPLAGALVLALTLRHRALVGTLAGMVPALVVLALWKKIGLGHLPLLALGATREAAGTMTAAAPVAGISIHQYFKFDWHHVQENVHALHEVFWSLRLLEFLLVAGAVGLVARSRARGALVVAWFLAFVLIKGTVSYAGIYDTSLYRFLLPAWPAWVLIVAGVIFCLPVGPARRARQLEGDQARAKAYRPLGRRLPLAAAVVLALGPLVAVAASSPIPADRVAQVYRAPDYTGAPVPVVDFGLRGRLVGPHTVRLDWADKGTARALTSYQVYKGRDAGCLHLNQAVPVCFLDMVAIGTARGRSFVDPQADGRVEYRVALGPGRRIQPDTPALLLLSKPITMTLR